MNRLMLAAAALAALCLFWGCDDDSGLTGNEFRVNPASVTLSATDRTVVLTAEGGEPPLAWSVTDPALGSVTESGRTVTYTRTDANGANTVRVADSRTWTAKAVITQQQDAVPAPTLAVSPAGATLNENGDRVVFTGSGGVGPYQWSVGNGSRGHLEVDGWSQATYIRDSSGNNTVIVTDAEGHAAIADVNQPEPGPLSVSANPGTLSNDGEKSVLTASGGTPPYTWSVLDAALGHLVGDTTADSIVYVRDHAGDNVVVTRDSAGKTLNTVIRQP